MAAGPKYKIDKSAGNILIVVKAADGYYAAGPAWKMPDDYVETLDSYEARADVPVVLSDRALIILLDKAKVPPEDWVAQNLSWPKPKKVPPPPQPPTKKGKR